MWEYLSNIVSILLENFTPLALIFFGLLVLDYITGLLGSLYTGMWDSLISWKGVVKTLAKLSIVIPVEILVHTVPIEYSLYVNALLLLTGTLCITEAGSLIENYGILDVKLNKKLTNMFYRLRDEDDNPTDDDLKAPDWWKYEP